MWHGGFASPGLFAASSVSSNTAVPTVLAKSKKLHSTIRWSKEVINTRPQSIALSQEDADQMGEILLTQEGIYQVDFILFIPDQASRPEVQLKLDDKVVVTSFDDQKIMISSHKQMHFTCFVNSKFSLQKLSVSLGESRKKEQSSFDRT